MNINIRARSLIPVCILASLVWLPTSAAATEEVAATAQSVRDIDIAVTAYNSPILADLPITIELKKLIFYNPDIKSLLIQSLAAAYSINPSPTTNPGAQGATDHEKLQSYYKFVNDAAMVVPNQILDNPPNLIRDQILQTICAFYFLVDQPLDGLKDKGYFKPSLQFEPRFSAWLVKFVDSWGSFLDTPASWSENTYNNFYNDPKFRLFTGDYVGWNDWSSWKTLNSFFSRYFVKGKRPIASPLDPSVVVSPADSAPQGVWDIDADSNIIVKGSDKGLLIKNIRYFNVGDLLPPNSPYKKSFASGQLTHTFLNVHDYHRYHFPLGGTVLAVDKIQQNVVLEVSWDSNTGRYVPIDATGWQFKQTRGVVIVNTDTALGANAGLVALIPVGMAHVSSINFEDAVVKGASVEKGDMLGTFLFGGSDYLILFQNIADFELSTPPPNPSDPGHIFARSKYGTVAPHKNLKFKLGDFVMEVPGASKKKGTQISLWDSNNETQQRWTLGIDDYSIRSDDSGYCLSNSGAVKDQAPIRQYSCDYAGAWFRKRTHGGFVFISDNGMCLDVALGKVFKGAKMVQAKCDGSDSQTFSIDF